jgi:hypothetical protein
MSVNSPHIPVLRERWIGRDLSDFGFMRKFYLFWFYDLFSTWFVKRIIKFFNVLIKITVL